MAHWLEGLALCRPGASFPHQLLAGAPELPSQSGSGAQGSHARGQSGTGGTWAGHRCPRLLLGWPEEGGGGGGEAVGRERGRHSRRVGVVRSGVPGADGALFPFLLAVVNSTGGRGSGVAFGGTMGSNALSFSSSGPGTFKSYSIRTSAATHRSIRK